MVHFSTSTKCVDPLCVKEMHDSCWLCNGISKPGLDNMEIGGQKCTAIYEVASNPGFFAIDQQECASMSFANTHLLGNKVGQFQPLIASPTCTLDASPSVDSIHLTTLPNKGAVDSEVNSPSKCKVGQKMSSSA